MAGFFNPKADLDAGALRRISPVFSRSISYLYDPDGFLRRQPAPLRASSNLLEASPKIDHGGRSRHPPVGAPAGTAGAVSPRRGPVCVLLEPSAASERAFAQEFLQERWPEAAGGGRLVAIHPGSGGERKNWPLERWLDAGAMACKRPAGAGQGRASCWWAVKRTRKALALPCAQPRGRSWTARGDLLGGRESAVAPGGRVALPRPDLFIGHDSGISHLAAAVGTPAACCCSARPTRTSGHRRIPP